LLPDAVRDDGTADLITWVFILGTLLVQT